MPAVGAEVYAIGNPKGLMNSLSNGLVSGHREDDVDVPFIQTTAAISPGSSGGPLLSKDGRVVGVTTAIILGGQNLNLAIPVKLLKAALNRRGPLQTLATAGGQPLDAHYAKRVDEVWVAIRKKQYAKALQLLALLRDSQEGSAAYWFCVGFVHGELGNHELAIEALRTSIRLDPTNDGAFYNLGISYHKAGRRQDALAAYQSALALNPRHVDALHNAAIEYSYLGEHDEAIASLQSIVATQPDSASAYDSLGLEYYFANRPEMAVASFKTALTLKPDYAECYSNMSLALYRLRRFDAAIKACRSAIRLNPKYAPAHRNMGMCYMGRNNNEAVRALTTAIGINPNDAMSHSLLGTCYHALGQSAMARRCLQRAVDLDPNGQIGQSAQDQLEQIAPP